MNDAHTKLRRIDCRLHRKSINREKVGMENIDELLAIRQIRQSFPPSNFSTIRY